MSLKRRARGLVALLVLMPPLLLMLPSFIAQWLSVAFDWIEEKYSDVVGPVALPFVRLAEKVGGADKPRGGRILSKSEAASRVSPSPTGDADG